MNTLHRENGLLVIRECRRRGLPVKAAIIAVETCLVESGFKNYANANVPASLSIPHDAVGYDHASLGVFQQQTGYAWTKHSTMGSPDGWGKPAVLMDVQKSAGLFFARLVHHDYTGMANGRAAQAVQGSAFPTRYQERDDDAKVIVAALWDLARPLPSAPPDVLEEIMGFYANRADFEKSMARIVDGRADQLAVEIEHLRKQNVALGAEIGKVKAAAGRIEHVESQR